MSFEQDLTGHPKIDATDVREVVAGVAPVDCEIVAKLANVLLGLSYVPTTDKQDVETRRFCMLTAYRVVTDTRWLMRERGF